MNSNDKIWFIHVNNTPDGPYTTDEIWEKLNENSITYDTYLWQKGYPNWIKIENETTFDQKPPDNPVLDDAPPTLLVADPNKKIEPSIWYINENQNRSGPFKESELLTKISNKQISTTGYIWKKGMKEWVLAIKSDEFKNYFKEETPQKKPKVKDFMDIKPPKKEPAIIKNDPPSTSDNKRRNPRAPLLARIIAHDNQDIAYMPCGNISTGGAFLYTEKFLWEPGTKLKLNIKSDELPEAFTVEGTVLNFSEQPNKGYSIKFLNISTKHISMLDNYIKKKI